MTMEEYKRYDAFFFDMDGTLTQSKTEIDDKYVKALLRLAFKYPVIIVSGASLGQMIKQLIVSNITYLSQNGNLAIDKNGNMLWNNELYEHEVADIHKHINQLSYATSVPNDAVHVQDRGCQVSFSLVGHDADQAIKNEYDPNRSRRLSMLKVFPFVHDTLTVSVGGTTCLDYTQKNGTKGKNVQRYIDMFELKNPVYVGDALFPGGNDSTVVGVCDTLAVSSVQETYDFIKQYI